MSRFPDVERHMDHLERVYRFASRDAFLGRDLSAGMRAISQERQYRRERAAEVEQQRRERLVREGLRRLERDYFGGA